MSVPLLVVRNLSKTFSRDGGRLAALDSVDLDVAVGETLALVGPSGSGKSTLARIVMRLLEPDAGSVTLGGTEIVSLSGSRLRSMRARWQMVFQDPHAAFNPRATVGRVLADPLRIHGLASAAERPAAVAALLSRVGLDPVLVGRRVHEISGGQRQRVAIARAVATKPALIVLDEAVSALDVQTRVAILDLLRDLQDRDRIAFLFVTHDLALVRTFADRVAILDAGRIVETGPARETVDAPRSATGRALVAAMPRILHREEGQLA
ncbi:MAG: ATP-binding cassette domain-containing protein [Rhizobiaceae bacterium]